ncbi:hypothetical protein RB25_17850 [Herbaspirillum rubrisubalbicans]|uniref:Uncharacterized protein n=2 Tax=Herbaspirillum rubrisubalbicans TaxID=80842 RepID=A0ABX9C235_9BURK|nr:hypothetical protein [Herbaspirillum rubrisubalbicans]QJP99025.1 hypothetical protein C798_01890 [Herbaspirillum rubrisubalbicans Os34]RAM64515.1 hypothetical protein RB24_11845 [Herbaspirillum rubrisubalbicans]RAN45626.1 hypothetical protein RB25_17850 [Herbaspirillum rubrisubalbicans]
MTDWPRNAAAGSVKVGGQVNALAVRPVAQVLYSGKRMKMRITRIAGFGYDKARGDQDFRSFLERSMHYTRFCPYRQCAA